MLLFEPFKSRWESSSNFIGQVELGRLIEALCISGNLWQSETIFWLTIIQKPQTDKAQLDMVKP